MKNSTKVYVGGVLLSVILLVAAILMWDMTVPEKLVWLALLTFGFTTISAMFLVAE